MIEHLLLNDLSLRSMLRKKEITFAGNKTLKIYGTLHCRSGKRMKKENRLFFADEAEALALGYRPCGHCMKAAYTFWKLTHGPL